MFFVLQDLLHISEYDLLEVGVHNHLHRLHLLTSLRLLQERERRRGNLADSPQNMICPYPSHQVVDPGSVFRVSKFPSQRLSLSLSPSVYPPLSAKRQRLIPFLSCKDMLMPGGSGGRLGGLSGGEDNTEWRTHTHTHQFTHTLPKVLVRRENSAEACSPAGFNHSLKCV